MGQCELMTQQNTKKKKHENFVIMLKYVYLPHHYDPERISGQQQQ
jgi:hypothetical protein